MMQRAELIQALEEHGVDKQTSKELFLYYPTTEDRQMQMLEWIMENADAFAISVT